MLKHTLNANKLILGSIPTMAKLDPVPYKAFHSLR
jgi:hypothetical protein